MNLLRPVAASFLVLLLAPALTGAASAAASMVASHGYHSCAVTTAGAVQCWGWNAYGQLGDGTTTDRATPVAVSGLGATATVVATSYTHTCALLSNGTVKCWGQNGAGQLGDATTTSSLTPVTVSGLTSVVAIAAGWSHTCALLSSGGLKCWGFNAYGTLGDGTTTNRAAPVDVLGGLTSGVASVAGGYLHTCATLTSGALKCWGSNNYGQVGDNSVAGTVRTSPVDVVGLGSGVSTTSLGAYSSCALMTSGGVKCWGYGGSGNIGDGAYTNRPTPVDVTGLQSGVATIAHGWYHVCASLTSGSVRCWGSNSTGELGCNTTSSGGQPVNVVGLAGGIASVSAGNGQTCGLVAASGGITCWGSNAFGQLGDGGGTNVFTPMDVPGQTSGVNVVSAGYHHACALNTAGAVQCWGKNDWGQLGDGTQVDRLLPTPVVGLSSGVVALTSGQQHTCALTSAGGVKCWGYNGTGALGDGATTVRLTPVDTVGLSSGVAAISAYGHHTCAVMTTGAAKCWGWNIRGQLGDNSTTNRLVPTDVTGLGSGVTFVSAGNGSSCAVQNGAAYCWGQNSSGQLGTGNTTSVLVPTAVSVLTSGVSTVITGYFHTCGRTLAGAAYCWGNNNSANLGDGSYTNRSAPTPVSGLASGTTGIAPGGDFTCAVDSGNSAKCWGNTFYGALGLGNSMFSVLAVPTSVPALSGITATISAGYQFACAKTTSGGAKCWGNNESGQIGNGTRSTRRLPSSSVVGFPANFTTTATIGATPNPSSIGQPVSLTATIVGISPSGTANFKDSGNSITGCTNLTVASGQATCSTSALTVGSHSLQADYSGDSNNAASSSAVFAQVVTPLPAIVSLTSSANPSVAAQPVTFTATVGGSSPTGTVSFFDGAQAIAGCSSVPLSGGNPATALCGPIASLATGAHTVTTAYLGDSNNAANQALLIQTVTQSASASVPTVAAGSYHTCSLDTVGTVRCWGYNYEGELGDASSVSRAVPGPVTALASGAVAIAANNHTCVVTSTGGVRCWGVNYYGGVGDGTTTSRNTPVDVVGLSAGVVAISVGSYHSCALLSGGAVKCWGYNFSGQLGTGNTTNTSSPVSVTGLSGPAIAIAAGGNQTCALLANGSLQCWGQGRLGDGTTTSRSTPTPVTGLSGPVVRVVIGSNHICALLTGGTVQCWGSNGNGQLGDGSTIARLVPTTVSGLSSVTAVSAGNAETCVLVAAGAVKCWGWGAYGKLGSGVVQSINSSPQSVLGLTSGAVDLAVGGNHVCATTAGGSIRCWGRNSEGQLGLGYFGLQLSPSDVSVITSGTAAISTGGFHACAKDTGGNLKCWGSRSSGAVGDGVISIASQTTPVAVAGLGATVAQVSASLSNTCVVTTAGGAKCWGSGSNGLLGDGTTTTRATPGDVTGLTAGVAAISAGYSSSCALTTAGGVKCWGYGNDGQLGNGTSSFSAQTTAVDVTGLTSGVAAITSGGSASCALLNTGGVKCWGTNGSGQLGDGTTTSRSTPVDVVGLATGVSAISMGGGVACALMTAGNVKCWGSNYSGALGQGGTISSSATPVDTLPLGGVATNVSVGNSHVCVRLASGAAKCWGSNGQGQIGDGAVVDRPSPVTLSGLSSGVLSMSAGATFSCALMSAGNTKCWGDNQAGQMGNGTLGYETTANRYVAIPSLTRPLSVSDSATVTAAVDGAMIVRYLAGLSGSGITQGIDTTGALRTDATELGRYFETIRPLLDIDGNNEFSPLTDGLLVIRYLLGQRGTALVTGAVGAGATRDGAQIQAYLAGLLP